MPPLDLWGKYTWIFFHTLATKIKNEESFNKIGNQVFSFIKKLCSNLPCPNCSAHANTFLSKIPPNSVDTKEKLINLLFNFHNTVNLRKGKPIFKIEDLETYKNYNLAVCYNNFIRVFNTKGDLKSISNSFHRERTLRELKLWILLNRQYFIN